MTNREILAALAAPFPADLVSWRVGSMKKDKSKGMALAYIDARDVMRRLDDVMGTDWQCDYVPMANGTCCCRIGLKIDGEWRWRSNGAGATDIEGEKGSYSDALKRAAVAWGIGRYLYDIPSPWVAVNEWKQIDENEMPKLRALLTRNGAPNTEKPAPEQRQPRQDAGPAVSASAPVDPKIAALEAKTKAATRAAEVEKSRQEEAEKLRRTFVARLQSFRDEIDSDDIPAHQTRREWNTWTQTLRASWSQLTRDAQNDLKAQRLEVEDMLKRAEARDAKADPATGELVAA